MTDDEFWHRLALSRLFVILGADDAAQEDARGMAALEAMGF